MLWTPANEFAWSASNFGATYTDAGFGTAVTASASANTKGAAATLLSAGTVTDDVYMVEVRVARGNTAATPVSFLLDILVDPAGGTSFSVLIPNLLCTSPSLRCGGVVWVFPLFIKAGSTIGAQVQARVGSAALRVGVRVRGKPSRPDLVKVGSAVQALGVNTGTSLGTTITPGSSAVGSYTATLGTISKDSWWWQCSLATTDTTMTGTQGYILDVAANATNKILCLEGVVCQADSSENMGKEAFGGRDPYRMISSGQDIYMRAASAIAAPDSTMSCAVYAVSG
jgi:hypothetical protein